ncbi:unnamed protein product [Prunus armeniaca]
MVCKLDCLRWACEGYRSSKIIIVLGSQDNPLHFHLSTALWHWLCLEVHCKQPFPDGLRGRSLGSWRSPRRRVGLGGTTGRRPGVELSETIGKGLIFRINPCRRYPGSALRLPVRLFPLKAHHEAPLGGLVHPLGFGGFPLFRHYTTGRSRNRGYTLSTTGTFNLTLSICRISDYVGLGYFSLPARETKRLRSDKKDMTIDLTNGTSTYRLFGRWWGCGSGQAIPTVTPSR